MNKFLLFLAFLFVLLSFSPSLYEISQAKSLPPERVFVLEHNYMFDYNFYLSRIREGQESNWLVREKYYNLPHQGSLFQIFYLYLGKIGQLLRLDPPALYHLARIGLGFIFLALLSLYLANFFSSGWLISAFLLIVTASSWPVLVRIGNFWRFTTYLSWWSAIDNLQRITFLPHVVFGQIFILFFIWKYSQSFKKSKLAEVLFWGFVGFLLGIVFPPTLVVIYTFLAVLSVLEILSLILGRKKNKKFSKAEANFLFTKIKGKVLPRVIFIFLSLPSLLYLQLMFKIQPWQALALFDIQHRIMLPYREYILALGPTLPLGLAGLIIALIRKEEKMFPFVSWIISLFFLFLVFEKVPQQSPMRFTEAAINIPLGVLASYFFLFLWQKSQQFKKNLSLIFRTLIIATISSLIILGLGVMFSMLAWSVDQVKGKKASTWSVPIGTQLVYPLKDFMEGIYFLKDQTRKEEVVLSYVTAGNFIPAYAGNFVYIGHANTPDEDNKEKIAARFFSGKMIPQEAREFLKRERITDIYFGPQERELGNVKSLKEVYPFIEPIYSNNQVIIYKFVY